MATNTTDDLNWICPDCTYINTLSTRICDSCGFRRSHPFSFDISSGGQFETEEARTSLGPRNSEYIFDISSRIIGSTGRRCNCPNCQMLNGLVQESLRETNRESYTEPIIPREASVAPARSLSIGGMTPEDLIAQLLGPSFIPVGPLGTNMRGDNFQELLNNIFLNHQPQMQPASKESIDEIANLTVSEKKEGDEGFEESKMISLETLKDEKCTVCICEFETNEIVNKLECGHYFHKDCIVKWLEISGICPNCKVRIDKKEDEEDERKDEVEERESKEETETSTPSAPIPSSSTPFASTSSAPRSIYNLRELGRGIQLGIGRFPLRGVPINTTSFMNQSMMQNTNLFSSGLIYQTTTNEEIMVGDEVIEEEKYDEVPDDSLRAMTNLFETELANDSQITRVLDQLDSEDFYQNSDPYNTFEDDIFTIMESTRLI